MSDLEMTRLCATAMGYMVSDGNYGPTALYCQKPDDGVPNVFFSPLTNDAQCFALANKMSIQIHHHGYGGSKASLVTVRGRMKLDDRETKVTATDLNRAIVECVAKMQTPKPSP